MIRDARESDSAAIAAIYAHHVLHGTATYDVEPPTPEEIVANLGSITGRGWPFIVAEEAGIVAGYAYASRLRERAAYAWTAEDSLYVHPDQVGKGVGTALLQELCRRAEACGFRQMIGVIGGGEPASIRFMPDAAFARSVGPTGWVGSTAAGSTTSICSVLWARALERRRKSDLGGGRLEALSAGEGEGWDRASRVVPAEPPQENAWATLLTHRLRPTG